MDLRRAGGEHDQNKLHKILKELIKHSLLRGLFFSLDDEGKQTSLSWWTYTVPRKASSAGKIDLHGAFLTAVWVAGVHCCVWTRCFICEVQPGLILKFHCDSLGPEEDAGNAIPGELNRIMMTVDAPMAFAQIVIESLINQVKEM